MPTDPGGTPLPSLHLWRRKTTIILRPVREAVSEPSWKALEATNLI